MLRFLFLMILAFNLSYSLAYSQDTNYWTYNYGTKSTLLGGAVIGELLDLSGTYYNPGGLALIVDPDVLTASKAYHYPNYSIKNVDGSNKDLNSSKLQKAPALVAGILNLKSKKRFILAYSFLTRQSVGFNIAGTVVNRSDPNSDIPEVRDNFTHLGLQEHLNETWIGVTWAKKIRKNIGIGVTQYFSFRSHQAQFLLVAEELEAGEKLALTLDARKYDYQTVSLLWKGGITFDYKYWTLGMTVTTPGIRLYGNGSAGINTTIMGQGSGIEDEAETYLATDYQQDVNAYYPSPFSLGMGITYKFKKTKLFFSTEWFMSVTKFDALDVKDFAAQTGEEKIPFSITHELDSVLNYAFGVEHIFGNHFSAYASISLDHSAEKSNSDTNLAISNWDMTHFMIGSIFQIQKFKFTLGIGYSSGKANRNLNCDRLFAVHELPIGVIEELKFKYSSIKIIFGVSF